jgi:1-acyl-sn-glycerol-3-phosphate acyltransferase
MALPFPDMAVTGRAACADGPTARRLSKPLQLLRFLYEYVVFVGLLTLFGVSSLIWSLAAAILYPILPRRLGSRAGQFMLMAGCRYFVCVMRLSGIIECDLAALDVLRDQASVVIAPNHPSLLDVVLVSSRLPRLVCAAKARLLGNWLFGGLARLAGFIRNDAPTRFVREGIRQLKAGRQLLIFPEGTRTAGATVDSFKGGFALIAKHAGAPVQTVFIDSNSQFLGKGWKLWRKPAFPLRYRVRLGPALPVEGDVSQFIRRLEAAYRRELTRRP